jgi:hypothetical protein
MGKAWDRFVPPPAVFDECLRVLKPGGWLLCFAGSRTVDLMTLSIRLAGFELRDSIAWLYGSGFPKSLDVSKAIDKAAGAERTEVIGRKILPDGAPRREEGPNTRADGSGWARPWQSDLEAIESKALITAAATEDAARWQGWGTALKPAFEPIVVARKPLSGTVAANVLQHGTGGLNIDVCRVAHANDADLAASLAKNPGRTDKVTSGTYGADRPQQSVNTEGRWPTNVVLDDTQATELDRTGPHTKDGVAVQRHGGGQALFGGIGDGKNIVGARSDQGYGGAGGPSRFFPVFTHERQSCADESDATSTSGSTALEPSPDGESQSAKIAARLNSTNFRYQAKAPSKERPKVDGVAHPTVKPLALMRWLVRLVTPPGGLVLDPFAGSGTTGEACVLEKFGCIMIESESSYLPLIEQRLRRSTQL